MEYFMLEQDTRLYYTIHLPLICHMHIADAKEQNLGELSKMTIDVRKGSEYEDYPDLLSQQLFLVSDRLKEVWELFLPQAEYKIFCLWDRRKRRDFYYYAYNLPVRDCLSEKSVLSSGRNYVETAVLQRDAMNGLDIVKIPGLDRHLVLVSLPVAEAILRRRLKGIRLTAASFDK